MTYQTINDMLEHSLEMATRKTDFSVPLSAVDYAPLDVMGKPETFVTLEVSLQGSVTGYEYMGMETGALENAATILGIPNGYLPTCPPELQCQNLNYWQQKSRGGRKSDTVLIRAWDRQDNQRVVRAIMTGEYVPFNNTDMLGAAAGHLSNYHEHPLKLVRPHLDRDSLWVKITALGLGGNYSAGVVLRHGETGNSTISVMPFLQRHSCENSTVWAKGGWSYRHRWQSVAWLRATVIEQMNTVFANSVKIHAAMIEAEAQHIPNFGDVVRKIVKDNKLESLVQDKIIVGSEGKETFAALVNGLTYAAHRSNLEPDAAAKLEELGGAVLMGDYRRF